MRTRTRVPTWEEELNMCGRSACSRDPDRVRHACAYRPTGRKKAVTPKWVSCNSQKYYPSYNVSPQSNTPVLLSSQHKHIQKAIPGSSFDPSNESLDASDERVLQTMKWGLVPSWHRGDPRKPPALLNNCRFEGMLEKPSFRSAIQKRQRCVVLADGFYEWHRKTSHKQPYFIFFTDCGATKEMRELSASLVVEEKGCGGDEKAEEGAGADAGCETDAGAVGSTMTSEELDLDQVKGRMLTMAGLFEIWKGEEEESLFTYTVITVEAHSTFAHIHDRMPAILDGDDAIRTWLDPSLSIQEVIHLLHPTSCLAWYPVSTVVNNVRNKSPECVMKIDPSMKVSSKQNTLMKWFSKSPKKETPQKERRPSDEDDISDQRPNKKQKLES